MNSAQSFKEYFEASFSKEPDQLGAMKLSADFFADFIQYTPIKLEMLQSYLTAGNIDFFYNSLADLKYLVEFSDNLTRYWYLLRGYSGALAKLKADKTVKGSKKLFSYYYNKYGDRRVLRNEHWFEKKRWEFMDELQPIYSEDELEQFILKYQKILSECLEIYTSFLMAFIHDLKNLLFPSVIPTEIESKTK